MKVYIVIYEEPYEFSDIVKVFDSKEKAEKFIEDATKQSRANREYNDRVQKEYYKEKAQIVYEFLQKNRHAIVKNPFNGTVFGKNRIVTRQMRANNEKREITIEDKSIKDKVIEYFTSEASIPWDCIDESLIDEKPQTPPEPQYRSTQYSDDNLFIEEYEVE